MVPLQSFSSTVMAEIVRRQPASPARTTFAWHVAVGAALARSTQVELEGGLLTVRARDPRWAREVERAADTILTRMRHLLGPFAVTRIQVVKEEGRSW